MLKRRFTCLLHVIERTLHWRIITSAARIECTRDECRCTLYGVVCSALLCTGRAVKRRNFAMREMYEMNESHAVWKNRVNRANAVFLFGVQVDGRRAMNVRAVYPRVDFDVNLFGRNTIDSRTINAECIFIDAKGNMNISRLICS